MTRGLRRLSRRLRGRPRRAALRDLPGDAARRVARHAETLPLVPPRGAFDPRAMDLHWVVPDFGPGAGGHATIFRLLHHLERWGHRHTLWLADRTVHATPERARESLRERFPLDAEVRMLPEDPSPVRGDAVVATAWPTAWAVRSVRHVRRRLYLVQDWEPAFHPMGAEALWSEATYRFGFALLTIGPWLAGRLRDACGADADFFDFAADTRAYTPVPGDARDPRRVAFYARAATPRRAVELGLAALELAARRLPDLSVDLFGNLRPFSGLAFPARDHGVLSPERLADLYRRCAVGMALSTTNPSLVPLEMMACGLPVVDLDLGPVNATLPAEVACRARPEPAALADALVRLLERPDLRERQASAALAHVGARSWETSARQVEAILQRRIAEGERPPLR